MNYNPGYIITFSDLQDSVGSGHDHVSVSYSKEFF